MIARLTLGFSQPSITGAGVMLLCKSGTLYNPSNNLMYSRNFPIVNILTIKRIILTGLIDTKNYHMVK